MSLGVRERRLDSIEARAVTWEGACHGPFPLQLVECTNSPQNLVASPHLPYHWFASEFLGQLPKLSVNTSYQQMKDWISYMTVDQKQIWFTDML